MAGDQDFSEDDASEMVNQSQERIYKLRRDKETRLGEIVAQSQAALLDVRERVAAAKKKKQAQVAQEQAEQIQNIMASVKTRREIEGKIVALVRESDQLTRALEELMAVGFRGREKDALKHLAGKEAQDKRK